MILQFGAGNFLRAFADLFIDQANRDASTAVGPVVLVQSTGRERVDALNAAGCRYHVAIQGRLNGAVVDETEQVNCIESALHAGTQWDRVLEAGADPRLSMILSNTTEAGLALADEDRVAGGVLRSFPAKLLAVLLHRYRAGLPGPWVVPCELVEANGARLRDLVLEQAALWGVDAETVQWLREECRWVNTLVDRIVPGAPRVHPLLDVDPLLIAAEPFAFWAVETEADFPLKHPAIVTARDIAPYTLRKVRILNGAHSALVSKGAAFGIETVRECVEHPEVGPWLHRLLFDEIVPVLEGRCDDPKGFAEAVLDRFRNPFIDHRLASIALHHEAKVAVRLRPTVVEYRERFGESPELLSEVCP
ncbi:MAG: altronate dehydrogenase [Verrucomicrobiaceae bacterium]|nr:altronate dehydrogenase [Verrucomicrobiaceae bacterium]